MALCSQHITGTLKYLLHKTEAVMNEFQLNLSTFKIIEKKLLWVQLDYP